MANKIKLNAKELKTRDYVLTQAKKRFIYERTQGFTNPETKQRVAAVSLKRAQRRWQNVETRWRNFITRLLATDNETREKFGLPAKRTARQGLKGPRRTAISTTLSRRREIKACPA